ncbi:hypothetical protein [Citreimonas salinaria]|uniref:Uncharacterized protein n=1 Tax=Citreimonas salinaria TaxID=321339 RepID=A0A1H3N6L8_9RHOB|nr:hypothetical protein [Citreimonas salinaria]SDY84506.1 hypothetical protein SAMN05444340_1216 [Citreimonas salinaria]
MDLALAPRRKQKELEELAIAQLDSLESALEFSEIEQDIEPSVDVLGPKCEFRNKISSASAKLTNALNRHGISAPELTDLDTHLEKVGACIADIGSFRVEALSVDGLGRKVDVAATPAGIDFAAQSSARSVIKRFEEAIEKLPRQDAEVVQAELVKSLFPDAIEKGGELRVGRLKDIRVKPRALSAATAGRVLGHIGHLGIATFENVTINSLLCAGNILESLTTPVQVKGVEPLRMHSSSTFRDHLKRTRQVDVKDLFLATTQAEVMVRGCLQERKGVSQPVINPQRAALLEAAVKRKNELTQLTAERDQRLRQAHKQEVDQVRKDYEARIERWKSRLIEEAGIYEAPDMAYGRQVISTLESNELTWKALDNTLNGMPITDRLARTFIENSI